MGFSLGGMLSGAGLGLVTGGPIGALVGGGVGATGAGDKALDAVGGAAEDFMNAGQNRNQYPQYEVDKDAYNYGGYNQGGQDWADDAMGRAQRAQDLGDQWEQQGADQILQGQANEANSRGYQTDALNLAQQAAYGNAPSVAQNQLMYGMNRNIAEQASQLGGARGAAGLAMAQQNTAANMGNILGQTNQQNAMLRAQEMQDARGQYLGGSAQQRGQDQGQQQFGLGMGQLGLGHQQLSQGYAGQGYGMVQGQAQLKAQEDAQRRAALEAEQNRRAGVDAANNEAKQRSRDKLIDTTVGLATTVGKAAAGGGAKPI